MMIAAFSGTCMERDAEIVDEVISHGGTVVVAELRGQVPHGVLRSGREAGVSPSSLPPV